MRTSEQLARYAATRRAKEHAKALAAGRIPGQKGTPKRISDEQRAASLAKKRKRDSASSLRIRTAARAAKAIAEGREPGKAGNPKKFTEEQRKASLKKIHANYREKNINRIRARDARIKQELRATPEGRKYLRELAVVHGAQRRAWKNNAPGTHTAADIKALFFEQKGLCGLCDLPLDGNNYHVDHWKPLSKGGSNSKDNLKLLHPKCNLMKHDKLPEELKLGARICFWTH